MGVKPERKEIVPKLDFRQLTPCNAVLLLNAILEARRLLEDEGFKVQIKNHLIGANKGQK